MTHVAVVQKSHHFRHPVSANSVRLAGTLKRLQDLQLTQSRKNTYYKVMSSNWFYHSKKSTFLEEIIMQKLVCGFANLQCTYPYNFPPSRNIFNFYSSDSS